MKTVLVVDDSPEDREAIIRILAQDQINVYSVLEAHDEHSCVETLLGDTKIDCVLLDYSMPGRDGLELLRKLLEHHDSLPVIMITGEGSEDIAVDALKLGAQDYIVKRGALQTDIPRRIANAIERKELALQIQRQQHALRDFADVLVHDLRAPLRSIRGPIEMLTQSGPSVSGELRDELHQFIINGVDHMDRLVVSLSAFSSIGKTELRFENINTQALAQTVQNSLDHDIKTKGSNVTFASEPETIWGSFEMLVQFLQNTIENGLKYNHSPNANVHVSITEDESTWQIDVSDNGIGIEEEYRMDVFEPFKRLHAQSAYTGTGLGLATCKRIADVHDAELHCAPNTGGGTRFVLVSPKGPVQ